MGSIQLFQVVSLCALPASALAGEFFLDQSEFLVQTEIINTNHFDDIVAGASPEYNYTFNEFAYTMGSNDPMGQGLNNDDGYIRLADGNTSMRIDLTGAPITAFSANLWGVDDAGSTTAGAYIIITVNGDEFIHSSTGPANFFSYVSETAFDSIEIEFSGGTPSTPVYACADNFTIARTVPTPGVLSMLAIGALAASRRNR